MGVLFKVLHGSSGRVTVPADATVHALRAAVVAAMGGHVTVKLTSAGRVLKGVIDDIIVGDGN